MLFNPASLPSLAGKVFLITGANSGLGFESAKWLTKKGGRVILACRSVERGEAAREALLSDNPGAQVDFMQLDLNSLADIRRFVGVYQERQLPLHCLINNAAIYRPPDHTATVDGIEATIGVNLLAPFVLTEGLLPILKASSPSSIINISSETAPYGKRPQKSFDEWLSPETNVGALPYANSKLAICAYTLALHRRYYSSGISSYLVDPGLTSTSIFSHMPSGIISFILRQIYIPLLSHGVDTGVLPYLYAANPEENEQRQSGTGWMPDGKKGVKEATIPEGAKEEKWQEELWKWLEVTTREK